MKPRSYLIFDTETTGLRGIYGDPKITELCLLAVHREDLVEDGVKIPRVVNKLSLCFNPKKMVTPGASMLTGLFNDALERQQPFNKDTVAIIKGFISNQAQPACLVAHNGNSFDFPLLMSELIRTDEELPEGLLCADSLSAFRELDADPSSCNNATGVNGQGCPNWKGHGQTSGVGGQGPTGLNNGSVVKCVNNSEIRKGIPQIMTPSKRDSTSDRKPEQAEVAVLKKPKKDFGGTRPHHSVSQKVVKRLDYGQSNLQRNGQTDSRLSLQKGATITKREGTKVEQPCTCPAKSSPSSSSSHSYCGAPKADHSTTVCPASDPSNTENVSPTRPVMDNKSCTKHSRSDSQESFPDDEFLSAMIWLEQDQNDICSGHSGDGPSGSMKPDPVPSHPEPVGIAGSAASTKKSNQPAIGSRAGLVNSTNRQNSPGENNGHDPKVESTELLPKSEDYSGKTSPQKSKDNRIKTSENEVERKIDVNRHRSNYTSGDDAVDQGVPSQKGVNELSGKSVAASYVGTADRFVTPTSPRATRRSFRLGDIYKRHFGQPPAVAHTAEDDCLSLLKLVKKFSPTFLDWVDCNCSSFATVAPMY